MLDPWIIEEILRRERRKREEEAGEQLPAPSPSDQREEPETPSTSDPGYEMPNPNEPARPDKEDGEDRPKPEGSDVPYGDIDINPPKKARAAPQ